MNKYFWENREMGENPMRSRRCKAAISFNFQIVDIAEKMLDKIEKLSQKTCLKIVLHLFTKDD